MHKPISIRLVIALAAIVYCVPANRLPILPGAPLGIQGGLVLIAFILAAVCLTRAVPGRWVWLGALAALAITRYASGALGPDLGWTAAYVAGDDPSRPAERSTEASRPGSTRIDRALDFERASFPVHFFNDIRRFNYYRPTDIARDTMPFNVSWRGVLVDRPAQAVSLALLTNGPASVQIGDQPLSHFPPTDIAQEYQLSVDSWSDGSPISVSYTRLFEVSPILRLLWVDGDGRRWPVGAPEIAPTPRDKGSSWLSDLTQWIGTLTSLGLLAVVAAALAASRGAGTGSLSPWERAGVRGTVTPSSRVPHPNPLPGGEGVYKWRTWEYAFLALIVLWAAIEPMSGWLPFNHDAILLSGGNDWLAYESFARDIQINGLLMNNGRPPGTGEAYYYQPAYAYALGLVHRILGESLGPVLWWQHACLGFAAMLVYGLGRRLWGPLAAIIAALLVMFFRPLELSAVSDLLLSENLLFLVLPGMLWLFVRAYQQPSLASVAWAGVALGLAGLTRSTPLLVLPFALIGFTLAANRSAGRRHTGLVAAVFLFACFSVVSLATVRNLIVSGKPVLITTSAGANLIEAHRPSDKVDLKGIDQNPLYDRLGLDRDTRQVAEFIHQDPGGYLATLWPTAAYAIGYVDPIIPGRGIEWPLLLVFITYAVVTITVPATRRGGAWLVHAFILTHWAQTAVFFSHQYGFRLPLPMYLPMMAVIGGGIAALLGSVERLLPHPKGDRQQFGWSATGALGLLAAVSIAASWTTELERAPERLYTLEGDVGRIARAIRGLPDEQHPSWAYGTGNDTRTREIAYLRGLAFPLIKWIDSDRGMVFPGPSHTGILGATSDGGLDRFSACLRLSDVRNGATLYRVSSPRDSRCLDVGQPSQSEFEYLSRVIGSSAPTIVRAGERFSAQVTWEVVERPVNRYRP
ncbi:MAG TPA: glycosyltransferase family 39 protein, partial [Chloroflexota bacterium]|nr:glycosyltransferase family 39 protein [Chloroflexota bacterium]